MNVNTTPNWNFEDHENEIRQIATEIVGDRAASVKITEIVRRCTEKGEGQESPPEARPIDRVIARETEKYINRILTNEFQAQNNIKEKSTLELEKCLNDYVGEYIPKLLLNTTISEIFIILARAERSVELEQDTTNNPFLELEQELISLTKNVITELVTPTNLTSEIQEWLDRIVPNACRDYVTSLLIRVNPFVRLAKASSTDSPAAPLVKQVAWEYIVKAKYNALAAENLSPQPLAGRDPADTQQMIVYLLSQLNVIQRQTVLLSRFRGNGISDRDIARHIGISLEELEIIRQAAFSKMSDTDTSKDKAEMSDTDTSKDKAENLQMNENDFLKHYEETWSKPVKTFASLMFGNQVYTAKIVSTVMNEANCFRLANKFDPDTAWQGNGDWIGLRQLTADVCHKFISELNETSKTPVGTSLWGKCLETLTSHEYRCLMLSTFFYKRDDGLSDIADILNQSNNETSDNEARNMDVKAYIQSALQKVIKKSKQLVKEK